MAFIQYTRVIIVAGCAAAVARIWADLGENATGATHMFTAPDWPQFGLTPLLVVATLVVHRFVRLPSLSFVFPMVFGTLVQDVGLVTIELPPLLLTAAYVAIGWAIGLRFDVAVLKHAARATPRILVSIFCLVGLVRRDSSNPGGNDRGGPANSLSRHQPQRSRHHRHHRSLRADQYRRALHHVDADRPLRADRAGLLVAIIGNDLLADRRLAAMSTRSAFFGGLLATGAIARTATNIRTGARSPVSGILHTVFVLAFMLFLAPLADFIPLASLAAILVIVAWNMSKIDKMRQLLRAPFDERIILLVTLALTVIVNLTATIEVGVVMAAMAFMHRMSQAVAVRLGIQAIEEEVDDFASPLPTDDQRLELPGGVELFQLRGPLFFGAVSRLGGVLERAGPTPPIFILRMREVRLIDSSGVGALAQFVERCAARGARGCSSLASSSSRMRFWSRWA
ncbi:AbrB family transcriptional regulator [Breoghania sp.]|uniref:AbrB family transcriptional regulator n=1 Tax=Breoghania sp. TaxID=2065378 RepID=UPI0026343F19|nr:AbrB family transcriptional regulator [Breoghania sp.]MDJ0931430.1 AbrB family transcriptional regulator [Breoghania sp.]